MIEVYQDAATAYLRNDPDGDVRILEECRLHSEWKGPGWVPDWSHPDRTTTVLLNKRASGYILPSPKSCEIVKLGILRIHGVVLTELVQVCPQVCSRPSPEDIRP